MATEFVIYDTMNMYKTIYENDFNRVDFNQEIVDFYTTKDKKHLWVVTNFKKTDARPDLERTIVFFHNGGNGGYGANLVEWDQVVFNPQKNTVEFGKTGTLKKSHVIDFPVRYRGETKFTKKVKINNDLWFYDLNRDRINLVISS